MRRDTGLGVLALAVGVLLLAGMVVGLRSAVGGGDPSAFFVTPFLLTAALVCLGVGLHRLRGARRPPQEPSDGAPGELRPDQNGPRD